LHAWENALMGFSRKRAATLKLSDQKTVLLAVPDAKMCALSMQSAIRQGIIWKNYQKEKILQQDAPAEGNRMKIEILGSGCPKCKQLEANARKALEETGKKAEVVKVTEIDKIIGYGVMSTPAIVINGEVKAYGRIPTAEEIKKWLK